MKAALDEFPLSMSAYVADTQHLSLDQHGAYLLIMMTMRRAGGWLDDDDAKLARICKITIARWCRIAPDIRALLVAKDGKLTQKRVLKDVGIALEISEKNRANGKSGGIAKALKSKEPALATATDSPAVRQNEPERPPLTLTSEDSDSKVKKTESKGSRGTTLPSDWVPSASEVEYGINLGHSRTDVDRFAEDMRLWAAANRNRAVGRKADWSATFKGWLRREADRKGIGNGPNRTRRGFGIVGALAAREHR